MNNFAAYGDAAAGLTSYIFPASVLFFAYLVRGIAGFGSALIAVPLLSLSMPLTVAVPLVVFLDYLGSTTQGVHNRQHIVWKDIWPLLPFSVLGVTVSLYLFESQSPQTLSIALGAFVIIFAVYQLLPIRLGRASCYVACPTGFFGGFVGTLFGTGGPFYVIYLNLRELDKTAFRATFATIFLLDGAMRLSGYAIRGYYDLQMLAFLAMAVPVAGLGLFFGGRLHVSLERESFLKLISVLLLGSGTALLMKA